MLAGVSLAVFYLMLLRERGVAWNAMTFAATAAGKPYITTPDVNPPIAYNISHDNNLVAMAFGPGSDDPPAFRIGVDVMKVALPQRQTFPQFVKVFSEQLTATETNTILSVPEDEGLRRFFWVWTMKEAYTKALGLGLGFEFGRIEYDFTKDTFTVDGLIPKGWRLVRFEIDHGADVYQGVAAKFISGDETTVLPRFGESTELVRHDATSFVLQALEELK